MPRPSARGGKPTGPTAWPAESFLGRLNVTTRDELLAHSKPVSISVGRMIFHEGTSGTDMLLILQGLAKISMSQQGVDVLLAIRGSGDVVGERGALNGSARTATVTAATDLDGRLIDADQFRDVASRRTDVMASLAAVLEERFEKAEHFRMSLVTQPALARLGRVLADLARAHGTKDSDGLRIDAQLTQVELATMAGIAGVTAQKAIKELREAGLIHTGYRTITIVDPVGLERIASGRNTY